MCVGEVEEEEGGKEAEDADSHDLVLKGETLMTCSDSGYQMRCATVNPDLRPYSPDHYSLSSRSSCVSHSA